MTKRKETDEGLKAIKAILTEPRTKIHKDFCEGYACGFELDMIGQRSLRHKTYVTGRANHIAQEALQTMSKLSTSGNSSLRPQTTYPRLKSVKRSDLTSHNKIEPGPATFFEHLPPEISGWLNLYLSLRVDGVKSNRTTEAVRRDLSRFEIFFRDYTSGDDLTHWLPRVTQRFINQLQVEGLRPATIARILASTRSFAKFLLVMRVDWFPLGDPTLGARPPVQDALRPKGLTERQLKLLMDAAYHLVCKNKPLESSESAQTTGGKARGLQQVRRPWRDYAILLLLSSGLRREEVCLLDLSQLESRKLVQIKCKGNLYRDVLLGKETAQILQAYIKQERELDIGNNDDCPALFLSSKSRRRGPKSGRLSVKAINRIVTHIANEANAHLPDNEKFGVHPHQLRHTHAYRLLQHGRDLAFVQRRLGHLGPNYLARYTMAPEAHEEAILDEIEIS